MIKKISCLLFAGIIIFSSTFIVGAVAEDDYDYTLDASSGKRVAISKCYSVEKIISSAGDTEFGTVSDLFVDNNDNIYVLCKEKKCVMKLDSSGELIATYNNESDKGFNDPNGIYVDENNEMFIADTGNNRIVHLTADGAYEEEFGCPDGLELDSDQSYSPTKLCISNSGYIYSMCYQNLVKIDVDNQFRGNIGSNKVSLSFTQILVNLFATNKQKQKLQKVEPEPYTNFIIGKDQYIYAVTLDYTHGQIKKLNAVGSNIFPVQSYGENYYNKSGTSVKPIFTDISVNSSGLINVIEKNSCKIYQYDNDGVLLCVFGGYGTSVGMLEVPTSLAEKSDGTIIVYDESKGLVFYKPTEFISAVHTALGYYRDCYYVEAMDYWQKALDICESYTLAHQGIGQAYYKTDKLDKAISEYRLGNLKSNYSQAFDKKRTEWLQNNFGWFFIVVIVSIILLIYGIKKFKKLSIKCEYLYKGVRIKGSRNDRR